jgi:arsenate reductase
MAGNGIHSFYGYAGCGTCRKAQRWLQDHGMPVDSIDITLTPPPRELLVQARDQLGGVRRLFNTSGQSYRALGAAAVRAMDEEQALDALAADGRLIKRPFPVLADGRITTGFNPQEWAELLPSPP